ncbi:exosortase [Alteromonas sp. CI.11.F.A3]|uniref:exosortase n=1 Tax=Alteromonas sp. CI.11.F.A3 TaxID=3079555 RepID=UPI002942C3A6|nr:exosortase [Alteromonas sp. CI.11.F.A3]WOI38733.1 exosortase [Alteromonas sp. CI.11.F.A3]
MWNNIGKLKHFWVFVFLLLAWAVFNYPIMQTLWKYSFDDGTYSHSFLVPFIILYLAFILEVENRIHFRSSVSVLWVGALIVAGLGLWVATLSQISLLYWSMSLLVLTALMFQVFVFNISTLFPLVYLVFIFPFWGSLALLFQKISVFMVTLMMSLTDIPVYVENEFVTIPSGIFEIAEGCSGLRYIIVALAISSLYVFLYLRTRKSAVIFTFFALFGALVTNWIRIVLLIVIGHMTDMESSLMTDHNNFGWYIYIPVAIFQFYLGRKLEDKEFETLGSRQKAKFEDQRQLPKRLMLSTLLFSLLFSSWFAVMAVNNDNQEIACNAISTPVTPIIYNASSACQEQVRIDNVEVTTLHYFFDGKTLDAKASYYLNSPIPDGFQEVRMIVSEEWNVLVVSDSAYNQWLLAYRYQVGAKYETNLYALKKAKLISGLKAINSTAIQWVTTKCKTNCGPKDLARLGL